MRACTGALALAGCIATVGPSTALGAEPTTGVQFDRTAQTIRYQAAAGQANVVAVSQAGDAYTITDSGAPALEDADGPGGCEVSGTVATCPTADVRVIWVSVSDLDDSVTVDAAAPGSVVVNGGSGNDTLNGSPGADQLFGGTGGDTINGNAGNDLVDGGLGDVTSETFDILDGGTGYDTLSYAERTAPVAVDLGKSFAIDEDGTADAAAGFDEVVGGLGDDEIVGSAGSETLVGGPGGDDGADTLCGDLGVDSVDYSSKDSGVEVTLDGPLATDQRHTEAQPNVLARIDCRPVNPLTGQPVAGPRDCTPDDGLPGEGDCVGDDVENVVGTRFADKLTGNDPDPLTGRSSKVEPLGTNRLIGAGGDDRLDGGLGADELEGGDGYDTVSYARHPSAVAATIDGAANDGNAFDLDPRSLLSDRVALDVEALVGTSGPDLLEGDGRANTITGGGGDDLVSGEGGNDLLTGGPGVDLLRGAAGDDLLNGASGDDTLEGGEGDDTLNGAHGDDTLDGGSGADRLTGGDGGDMADYSTSTVSVTVSADGVAGDGSAGEGDDVAADVESITGGDGSDSLVGNDGAGELTGGPGDDQLEGGRGADVLYGGPGRDTARYDQRTAPVTADLVLGAGAGEAGEADVIAADVENVYGGAGDDTLSGGAESNVLSGGAGNDTIYGGAGDDTLYAGSGDDAVAGGAGDDVIAADTGRDTLSGGEGQDVLGGGDGDDSLDGGSGADIIGGDSGVDTVNYASRSRAVTVDLEGTPDDGERGENDLVKASVESVLTGAGDDVVDTRDEVAGSVTCGAGTDVTRTDPQDRVASDCEDVSARALAVCTTINRAATMSRSGTVRLALGCSIAASGRLTLETAGRVRVSAKRRRVRLGSTSFTVATARVERVHVKLSRRGRQLVAAHRKLRVRATISSRARLSTRTLTARRAFTLRRGQR
jgi:Ca2+-binding RTX toxin-like protein